MAPATLYHYTCAHRAQKIRETGRIDPNPAGYGFAWFTDLEHPTATALGLTRETLDCDRTETRFEIPADKAVRWGKVRNHVPRHWRDALELAPGAEPRHWYVATEPIPITDTHQRRLP